MPRSTGYPAVIADVAPVTPTLRRFDIRATAQPFPPVSAGSHGVFAFGDAVRTWKNPYSIVARSDDGSMLRIIVRLAQGSRGGSAFLHGQGRPGLEITVLGIANLFPVVRKARRHILLSAGVGITPFLSYMDAMDGMGLAYCLHHYCRPEERQAFHALLADRDPGRVVLHDDPDTGRLSEILAAEPVSSRLSMCGPDGFMNWVGAVARDVGFSPGKIHSERFSAPEGGAAFRVDLARSGLSVSVGPEDTLLDALEAAGIEAPCLCRGGACGACRVAVLSGVPDHRDHVLAEAERAAGDCILTCVSRARTATLTLDL
ncbi:oxidoreductase [Gluconacetobacter tumulisoli]|uniref:Oxidoreductase n=2 Tax=Gluconacetobacter tumulisoli TaxID=1286189 RepID=A0A7W4K7I5_9PROT|nr:oxidoreductase [Gluconacetobacter tumulisoli]